MSDPDKDALVDLIDGSIDGIEKSTGEFCGGHGPLARAVVVLLKCQRAQIKQRSEVAAWSALGGSVGGAVLLGIVEFFKATA